MAPLPYRAPAWLPGGHAQTIAAATLAHRPQVRYRRELWSTPDDDVVAADFAAPEPRSETAPVLILLHGLEGSSQSHYARALMDAATARGWRALVVHFRGCGGEPNRLPRAYHSGDSDEADWIVRTVAQRWPGARLHAAGVSLGGNVLAKWLGEQGAGASILQAAAVVSVPFDLVAAGLNLATGFNAAVYGRHFLRSMRRKAADLLARHPGLVDAGRIRRCRNLQEFDDAFTAPLHGFRDVMHYWASASSAPWLPGIRVPTLALNALDDPFIPAASLPAAAAMSPDVKAERPRHGGHAAFIQGAWPGRLNYVPARVLGYFERGT
jgi:predicted alpha/beta-fold hydrolase